MVTIHNESAPPSPYVAFVLGGGGRWGAVEVGMLQALVDAEILPTCLGHAIGAFNGAVFAADPTADRHRRRARCGTRCSVRSLRANVDRTGAKVLARLRVAIQDPRTLRDILAHACRAEPSTTWTSTSSASPHRSSGPPSSGSPGDLIERSRIGRGPGLFPPIEIDGEHYYDGGLVNSVPVDRALELGATEIYVLQVGRLEQPLRVPTRIYETALLAFEIARRHRFGHERARESPA